MGVAALVVDEGTLAGGVLDVLFAERRAFGAGGLSGQLEDVQGVPRVPAGAPRDQVDELVETSAPRSATPLRTTTASSSSDSGSSS